MHKRLRIEDKKTVNVLRGNHKMPLEKLRKAAEERAYHAQMLKWKNLMRELKKKQKTTDTTKPPAENQNNKASS